MKAFGWGRAEATGGLLFLTLGNMLLAPMIGALIERLGVRRVALVAQAGLFLGYVSLTLNRGSLTGYYLAWALLAVLGAGTSPIVWTRAVASWFDLRRGLALGLTLGGTGVVAVVGPSLIAAIIGAHGWQAGFYALAAAQWLVGMPLTFLLLRSRDQPGPGGSPTATTLTGLTVRQAAATSRFWRLLVAFYLISIVVGGLISTSRPCSLTTGSRRRRRPEPWVCSASPSSPAGSRSGCSSIACPPTMSPQPSSHSPC